MTMNPKYTGENTFVNVFSTCSTESCSRSRPRWMSDLVVLRFEQTLNLDRRRRFLSDVGVKKDRNVAPINS